MPFCLIPFIAMIREKRIQSYQLGICMALMLQTHLFSTIILLLVYIPAFIYAWMRTEHRKKLLRSLFHAIFIFFALTANVWFAFIEIYGGNEILSPFINLNMSLSTINHDASFWLVNPLILVVIITVEIFRGVKEGKMYSILHKVTMVLPVSFCFCLRA